MRRTVCFQLPSLLIGKVWIPVMHICTCALGSGHEARIVQIDFSAAIARVNHQGILYKLALLVLEVLCCLY